MTFKSALDIDCGLRYLYDTLHIVSPCGRKMLLASKMMTTQEEIVDYYRRLDDIYHKDCAKIVHKLMCLKDIENTLSRLAADVVLDDIELFEVKYLALTSNEVLALINELKIEAVQLPALDDVVQILDPDHLNIPSFYIYDSYAAPLKELRRRISQLQGNGETLNEEDRKELATLLQQNADIELEVREKLCKELIAYSKDLKTALANLSLLDILTAKAEQMRRMQLSFPTVGCEGETTYKAMFNPMVKDLLATQGREYMPVDITVGNKPVTIIGANMGGKSVVIKSLALNQLLVQYGFGTTAASCHVLPVEEVALCIGDEQSIVKGVSSFAGEILAIDTVIKKLRSGVKMLALIDEPARTTNPIEGTALVEGLLDVVGCVKGGFVLTTHYNIENDNVKRYKVRGLKNGVMDYTLQETNSGEVPCEAIAIAESLGIDSQWIEKTKTKLNK